MIVFSKDGTIGVFANPPTNEPISRVSVFLQIGGLFRVDANGTTVPENATAETDLEAPDDVAPGNSPYPYAATIPLPEGMTQATGASFALTFTDENLNSAVYTGSVQNEWTLDERSYSDDKTAADEQDYNDTTGTTHNASGYDYVHTTTTGGVYTNEAASTASDGASPQSWAYRIVQPSQAALVGTLVDGAFDLVPPSRLDGSAPTLFALYTGTMVPLNQTPGSNPFDEGPRYYPAGEQASPPGRYSAATTKGFTQNVPAATTTPNIVGTQPSVPIKPVTRLIQTTQRTTPSGASSNTYSPSAAAPPKSMGPPTGVMIHGKLISLHSKPVDLINPNAANEVVRAWIDTLDPDTKETLLTLGVTMLMDVIGPAILAAVANGARIAASLMEGALARAAGVFRTETTFLAVGGAQAASEGEIVIASRFANQEAKLQQVGLTIGKSGREASGGFTILDQGSGPTYIADRPVADVFLEARGLGKYALRQGEEAALKVESTFASAGSRVTLEDVTAIHARIEAKLGPAKADQVMNDLTTLKERFGANDEGLARAVTNIKGAANPANSAESLQGHIDALNKAATNPNIIAIEERIPVSINYKGQVFDAPAEIDLVKASEAPDKLIRIEYKKAGKILRLDTEESDRQLLRLSEGGRVKASTTKELWVMKEDGLVDDEYLKAAGERGIRVVDGSERPLNDAYYKAPIWAS